MGGTGRFDQLDTATHPYGRCVSCDVGDLATKEVAHEHMHANLGHRVSVLNKPRQDRIDSEVYDVVADALYRAFEDLYEQVDDGEMTPAELKTAMRSAPDLGDEWETYLSDRED